MAAAMMAGGYLGRGAGRRERETDREREREQAEEQHEGERGISSVYALGRGNVDEGELRDVVHVLFDLWRRLK